MNPRKNRVCPVERAGGLDNIFRRWLQNPWKILNPYIMDGMTAMDLGCGPGHFTLAMAQLVGGSGRVIAVDLQEGMLDKLRRKIQGTELEERIVLHRCSQNEIGVLEKVDFALAFYMVHEIPDQSAFFQELYVILQPAKQMLVVEPSFHVSKSQFKATMQKAKDTGFRIDPGPKVILSKSALLKKN
jgi:ubiquinone/menaquinone biosynthesis C-methylase UbiE